MNILLDSFAIIELMKGSPLGAKVKQIFQQSGDAFTTSANLYEVKYRLEEISGPKAAEDAIEETLVSVESIAIDNKIALRASALKKKFAGRKIGAIDFFVLATAEEFNLKIVSGDPHFKGLANVIFID